MKILPYLFVIVFISSCMLTEKKPESMKKASVVRDVTQYVFVVIGTPIRGRHHFQVNMAEYIEYEDSSIIYDGLYNFDVEKDLFGYDSTIIKVRKYYFLPMRAGSTQLFVRYPDGIDTVKIFVEDLKDELIIKKVIQALKP